MTTRQIEKRFHVLVIKEAFETATEDEIKKLDRYQALRRNGREKIIEDERFYWAIRNNIKALTHAVRVAHGQKATPPSIRGA